MNVRNFLSWYFKHEKIVVPVFTTLFVGAGFFVANFINIYLSQKYGRYIHLETSGDAYIPFVPAFIFAYILYYFYPILFPLVVKKRKTLYVSALSFIFLQIISTCCFIAIPSKMVRPEIDPSAGVDLLITSFIYHIDSGFNLLPSLHVGHTTVITLLFFHTRHRLRYWVSFVTFLIWCSTVLVKQHYIIDLPFGLLFAAISFIGAVNAVKFLDKFPALRPVRQTV